MQDIAMQCDWISYQHYSIQYNATMQYDARPWTTICSERKRYKTRQDGPKKYTMRYNTAQQNSIPYEVQDTSTEWRTMQLYSIQYNTAQCTTMQYKTMQLSSRLQLGSRSWRIRSLQEFPKAQWALQNPVVLPACELNSRWILQNPLTQGLGTSLSAAGFSKCFWAPNPRNCISLPWEIANLKTWYGQQIWFPINMLINPSREERMCEAKVG